MEDAEILAILGNVGPKTFRKLIGLGLVKKDLKKIDVAHKIGLTYASAFTTLLNGQRRWKNAEKIGVVRFLELEPLLYFLASENKEKTDVVSNN